MNFSRMRALGLAIGAPAALITTLTGCDAVNDLGEMLNFNIMYVPSTSMEPTLPLNSRFTASRVDSGELQRGDLAIIQLGIDEARVLRLIGMPGDTVAVDGGSLILNGEKLRLEPQGQYDFETADGEARSAQMFREYLPGDQTGHLILDLHTSPLDDVSAIRVPANHYYLLGDNRDNSADSRMDREDFASGGVGLVTADEITHRVDLDSVTGG